MAGDYRLLEILDSLRTAVLDDGHVTLGETSVILRAIRPFVLKGEKGACELDALLKQVREDGVVTDDESGQIAHLMDKLLSNRPRLSDYVREIPDFPKPGVLFRDVTGILESGEGFNLALSEIAEALEGVRFDLVAAPESRGFIFGAAVAARFGKAFVPIRKPGKLPRRTISEEYGLEYGKATLHMHADAVIPGERAVIVDDLLATGGTACAAARLVERLGGTVVKMIFPIELGGFGARGGPLKGYDVTSLVRYPGK